MKKLQTLVVVHDDTRILLGMKKRGFGEGRWNGFGGKVLDNESVEEAAIREVQEETGIIVQREHLRKRGVLDFSFEQDGSDVLEVHIFSAQEFSGLPRETDEMLPQWFTHDSIPFHTMWKDDIFWLPKLLKGSCFRGAFHFGGDNDEVLKQELTFGQCEIL